MNDIQHLLARLEAMEKELAELRAERAARAREASGLENRNTRRGMITGAAAALGALGMSAATGALAPRPAEAATGGNMIIGQSNTPTNPGDVTRLLNASGQTHTVIFQADNNTAGTTALPATARISVAGTNAIAAVGTQDQIGVYGKADNGYGIHGEGVWPIRLVPRSGQPPTTVGGRSVGEGTLYYGLNTLNFQSLATEDLFVNMSGSGFRRLMSEQSVGVLIGITPVRVLDTRGAPFGPIGFDGTTNLAIAAGTFPAAGARRDYRIGGQFGIPAGLLRGLLGNVTLIQSAGSGGFATVQAGGSTGTPTTSSVNPTGAITANFFFTRTNATNPRATGENISVFSIGDVRDIAIDITGIYI